MGKLSLKKCVPCEGGTPPFNEDEIAKHKKLLDEEAPGWNISDNQLYKNYRFPDFKSALELTNKIGVIAESEGHHPEITLGWGFVKVVLWTHAVGGLSENDFIEAAKIETLIKKN